jgi:hypothetical protein
MIFDKLDRLMPNTVDFTDLRHRFYAFVLFCPQKAKWSDWDLNPRPLDPISAKYSEGPSDLGYSAPYLC